MRYGTNPGQLIGCACMCYRGHHLLPWATGVLRIVVAFGLAQLATASLLGPHRLLVCHVFVQTSDDLHFQSPGIALLFYIKSRTNSRTGSHDPTRSPGQTNGGMNARTMAQRYRTCRTPRCDKYPATASNYCNRRELPFTVIPELILTSCVLDCCALNACPRQTEKPSDRLSRYCVARKNPGKALNLCINADTTAKLTLPQMCAILATS